MLGDVLGMAGVGGLIYLDDQKTQFRRNQIGCDLNNSLVASGFYF